MQPYPLLFEPILKPKVWGGRSLEALGKNLPPGEAIGESWELADLPDTVPGGRSVISNGEMAGQTLRQAIARFGKLILGDAKLTPEGGFPLLIKYLDARENLSVQVHPDEKYVATHPECHLKSEAWVVVQAEPGAVIYKGIKPGVTLQQFAAHLQSEEVVDDLIAVPVKPGEAHYLPSGTCHALGAGIVVAEIQTPSDTTFRVYDWGRSAAVGGAPGAGRRLHIEQALQCIRFGSSPHNQPRLHKPIDIRGVQTMPLVRSEYFEIDRVDAITMARFQIVTSGLPEVWMMIAGSGRIETQHQTGGGRLVDLEAGTTALLPAGLVDSHATLARGAWMLRVRLPSPLKGMIA